MSKSPHSVPRTRTSTIRAERIPCALQVFAWNVGNPLTALGKKQIALNVVERGRAWHWTKLPEGWFDLECCLAHGQRKTKAALRTLFSDES